MILIGPCPHHVPSLNFFNYAILLPDYFSVPEIEMQLDAGQVCGHVVHDYMWSCSFPTLLANLKVLKY